jgi:hypothetical protein
MQNKYYRLNIPNTNSLIIFISILGSVLFAITRIAVLQLIYILPGILLLVSHFKYISKYYTGILFGIYFIIIYVLLRSLIYYDLKVIFDIGRILSHVGIAIALLHNKSSYIILGFYSFLFFTFLTLAFFLNISPDSLLSRASGNMVNLILIFFITTFNLSFYFQKRYFLVYPMVFLLLFSFWTTGRSGIIVSFFLLLFVVFFKIYYNNKISFVTKIILFFLSISAILVYFLTSDIIETVLFKFGERRTFVIGDARLRIISDYFSKLNINSILFGIPPNERLFAGFINPHNSFLDFHSYFGIISIGFMVLIISFLIVSFLRKKFINFIILFLLLTRAFTDVGILIGFIDYTLYFVFFSLFLQKDSFLETNSSKLYGYLT